MNILFLEDDASISEALEGILEDNGHNIYYAYDIYEANEHLSNYEINFIITDLNMPSAGLQEHELKDTKEGTLSGFIWLINHVFRKFPALRTKTIIFSAYSDVLYESYDMDSLKNILILPKEVGIRKNVDEIIKKINKS